MKTYDIGNDWFLNLNDDGSLTLRNSEIGQRVNIPAYSASLLYRALAEAAQAQTVTTNATHGPEEAAAARRVGMID